MLVATAGFIYAECKHISVQVLTVPNNNTNVLTLQFEMWVNNLINQIH